MTKKKLGGFFAALAAVAAGVVASRGGKHPAPAAEPLAMWESTCRDIWRVELRRDIDPAGLEGCIQQARAGGTKDSIVATVRASAEYREVQARPVVVPPPVPVAVSLPPLTTDGPIFLSGGQPWRWRGVSAFALLDRFAKGQDISDTLSAYQGYNLLRVWPYVPAKDWGAAAWDAPAPDVVVAFLTRVEQAGFYVEITLLLDDDPARIEPAKRLIAALAAAHPNNLVLEASNEPITHKAINTAALKDSLAASGFLYSSGDYEDVRRWYGRYAGVHTKRQKDWPRYSHDLWEWFNGAGPEFSWAGAHAPIVADEPPKPNDIPQGMTEADVLAYFGGASVLGAGATWHCETGKFGKPPVGGEITLAAAALRALTAFPADAARGPYRRIVEPGNEKGGPTETSRTYVVGNFMVRSQQVTKDAPEAGWTALEPSGVLWKRQ